MKKHAGHFKSAGQEPRRGKGGRQVPGPGKKLGRPTKADMQLKKLAADALQKRIEEGMGSVADAYLALATGLRVGHVRRKLDPATTRHAIERFLGQAPRKLILDLQDTVESFFEQVEKFNEEEGDK